MNNLLERASGRVAAVAVALVLAIVAVIAVNDHVRSREQDLVDRIELVEAWQFVTDLEAGTAVSSLFTADGEPHPDRLRLAPTPRESLPSLALSTADVRNLWGRNDFVLVAAVEASDYLKGSMFGIAPEAPKEAFEVPPGQVAVSFDVEVTAGVANFLDPDDRISILATIGGARGDAEAEAGAGTRILLQDVRVLAVGVRVPSAENADSGEVVRRADDLVTLTVAVPAVDAERLVFAVANGTLHIALLPPMLGDFVPAATPGRDARNLFER